MPVCSLSGEFRKSRRIGTFSSFIIIDLLKVFITFEKCRSV